jgi:hypothetical protein
MFGKFGHNVAVLSRVLHLGQSFHFPEHFPHGVLFNQPGIPHLLPILKQRLIEGIDRSGMVAGIVVQMQIATTFAFTPRIEA